MRKMRFLFAYFILLLTSFVFVSCDKESDLDSKSLVGDWIVINEKGYEIWNGDKDTFDNDYPESDYEDYQEVFRFKETDKGLFMTVLDYSEVSEIDDESYYVKVELRGNEIVPLFEEDEDDFSVEEMTFEIRELSSTRLVLYNYEKYNDEDGEGSFESTITCKKLN